MFCQIVLDCVMVVSGSRNSSSMAILQHSLLHLFLTKTMWEAVTEGDLIPLRAGKTIHSPRPDPSVWLDETDFELLLRPNIVSTGMPLHR